MNLIKIRAPELNDIEVITEIERDSFPSPWDESIFFQLTLSHGRFPVDDNAAVIMRVMTKGKKVIGYIVWEEYYDEFHSHILNLAVNADNRQLGYGTRLLSYALESMKAAKLITCELEVRESNHWARHLYENAGMIAVDRSVKYYESEDAIIYALRFD